MDTSATILTQSETIATCDLETVCRCDQCLYNIAIVPGKKTCCKHITE